MVTISEIKPYNVENGNIVKTPAGTYLKIKNKYVKIDLSEQTDQMKFKHEILAIASGKTGKIIQRKKENLC